MYCEYNKKEMPECPINKFAESVWDYLPISCAKCKERPGSPASKPPVKTEKVKTIVRKKGKK